MFTSPWAQKGSIKWTSDGNHLTGPLLRALSNSELRSLGGSLPQHPEEYFVDASLGFPSLSARTWKLALTSIPPILLSPRNPHIRLATRSPLHRRLLLGRLSQASIPETGIRRYTTVAWVGMVPFPLPKFTPSHIQPPSQFPRRLMCSRIREVQICRR
ncbi:hypothetical protein K523DRAFT_68601 [Schizophyllum commune Tattone D]|nr:hypothetical protein K523DRAFT_68601 [Schizophyllum commune Tattone D]